MSSLANNHKNIWTTNVVIVNKIAVILNIITEQVLQNVIFVAKISIYLIAA